MEENSKKQKIKEISIAIGVSVAVIVCLLATSVGVYTIYNNENTRMIQGLADNSAEINNENPIEVDEKEEQIEEQTEEPEETEEQQEEQTQEEVKEQLSPEELKKRQEAEKKRQEELKKKKEEEAKRQAQAYPYWIKVNYVANTVTIYKKDVNGDFTIPVKAMICSTGSSTPRSGIYKTKAKYAWKALIGSAGKYCTRITGQILFHSVPYLNGDKNKFEYWEYDRLGETRSLGCVRLTVADALWIYNNCPLGTSVEFYGSSNPGPLGKPSAPKISGYGWPLNNWDPTDPDPENPWHNKKEAQRKAAEEAAAKKAAEEAAAKKAAEEAAAQKAAEEAATKKKAEEEAAKKKAAEEAAAKKKAEEEAAKKKKQETEKIIASVVGKTDTQAAEFLKSKGFTNVVKVYSEDKSKANGVVLKYQLSDDLNKITLTVNKISSTTNNNTQTNNTNANNN
ncbi:MAG: L,D-transpeptidase [Clostridia bacterium]|nr:L,D-transpeptidase [Clostridia bacterium]